MKTLLFLIGMVTGYATGQTYVLAIGLNAVDPAAYDGWDGRLVPCENDAAFYAGLVTNPTASKQSLLTANATRAAVKASLRAMAGKARRGDLVLIGYSGHGTQVPDSNGDEKQNNPKDGLDEAWCLYDGLLVDDQLFELWAEFAEGVDIVVISDSCHSGTMTKDQIEGTVRRWNLVATDRWKSLNARLKAKERTGLARASAYSKSGLGARPALVQIADTEEADLQEDANLTLALYAPELDEFKAMPFLENHLFVEKHADTLAQEQKELAGDFAPLRASVFLYASSRDEQTSLAPRGLAFSLYTYFLHRVWTAGPFTGTNRELSEQVVKKFPREILKGQHPQVFLLGPNAQELAKKPAFVPALLP